MTGTPGNEPKDGMEKVKIYSSDEDRINILGEVFGNNSSRRILLLLTRIQIHHVHRRVHGAGSGDHVPRRQRLNAGNKQDIVPHTPQPGHLPESGPPHDNVARKREGQDHRQVAGRGSTVDHVFRTLNSTKVAHDYRHLRAGGEQTAAITRVTPWTGSIFCISSPSRKDSVRFGLLSGLRVTWPDPRLRPHVCMGSRRGTRRRTVDPSDPRMTDYTRLHMRR